MNAPVLYLLDTNIVSHLARNPNGPVQQRIATVYAAHGPQAIAISFIVASELRFGLAKCESHRLKHNVESILQELVILPMEPPIDLHYADIRLTLERAGTPIGPNDLFIAAHARAFNAVCVTDNIREFSRVPGLVVENWLDTTD